VGASLGPPSPVRCPHCGLEILDLRAHLAEAHPDQPQQETDAEREAREREEARQAAVAAEIARREADAAQRKEEARLRRQAIEGSQAVGASPQRGMAIPKIPQAVEHRAPVRSADAPAQSGPTPPAEVPDVGSAGLDPGRIPGSGTDRSTTAGHPPARPAEQGWDRVRRAMAQRTVLTGVVRSCKPFGAFVDLGGIEGLVRSREMPAERGGSAGAGLQVGQTVTVVVIAIREDTRRVELSMRRAHASQAPPDEQPAAGAVARQAEGPMAMAFRLAREKQKRSE
jgi:predicted RNA-binding protein with RPS1 domain